jgi:putative transposase
MLSQFLQLKKGGDFAVEKKQSTVNQILPELRQAEAGVPVGESIRQMGISEQTSYQWENQYIGVEIEQVRQLRELREENPRLKDLVNYLTIDLAMLGDVLPTIASASSSRMVFGYLQGSEHAALPGCIEGDSAIGDAKLYGPQ